MKVHMAVLLIISTVLVGCGKKQEQVKELTLEEMQQAQWKRDHPDYKQWTEGVYKNKQIVYKDYKCKMTYVSDGLITKAITGPCEVTER